MKSDNGKSASGSACALSPDSLSRLEDFAQDLKCTADQALSLLFESHEFAFTINPHYQRLFLDFIAAERERLALPRSLKLENLKTDAQNCEVFAACAEFLKEQCAHDQEHWGHEPPAPELLILSGMPGTGKSSLAGAVANDWLEMRGRRIEIADADQIASLHCRFTDESRGERRRRRESFEAFVSADLLIIDRLCADGRGFSEEIQLVLPEILRLRRSRGLSSLLLITLPDPRKLRQASGDLCFEAFKAYPKAVCAFLKGASRRKSLLCGGKELE